MTPTYLKWLYVSIQTNGCFNWFSLAIFFSSPSRIADSLKCEAINDDISVTFCTFLTFFVRSPHMSSMRCAEHQNLKSGKSDRYFLHSASKRVHKLFFSPVFLFSQSVQIVVTFFIMNSYTSLPTLSIIPFIVALKRPIAPRSICCPIPMKSVSRLRRSQFSGGYRFYLYLFDRRIRQHGEKRHGRS